MQACELAPSLPSMVRRLSEELYIKSRKQDSDAVKNTDLKATSWGGRAHLDRSLPECADSLGEEC